VDGSCGDPDKFRKSGLSWRPLCHGIVIPDLEFQELGLRLRGMFRGQRDAFARLANGGKLISRNDFWRFVHDELGMDDDEVINHLFNAIDVAGDGCITPAEFKLFFTQKGTKEQIAKESKAVLDKSLQEFRAHIQGMSQVQWWALEEFVGADDGVRVDRRQFHRFMHEKLAVDDEDCISNIYKLVDNDGDGYISPSEFKVIGLGREENERPPWELRFDTDKTLTEVRMKMQAQKQTVEDVNGGDSALVSSL
jgi:Ca2+-binding EF-hand superfamily protein